MSHFFVKCAIRRLVPVFVRVVRSTLIAPLLLVLAPVGCANARFATAANAATDRLVLNLLHIAIPPRQVPVGVVVDSIDVLSPSALLDTFAPLSGQFKSELVKAPGAVKIETSVGEIGFAVEADSDFASLLSIDCWGNRRNGVDVSQRLGFGGDASVTAFAFPGSGDTGCADIGDIAIFVKDSPSLTMTTALLGVALAHAIAAEAAVPIPAKYWEMSPVVGPSPRAAITAFQNAGLPVNGVTYYTPVTDGNGLLGRPGEYIAKVNWNDARDVEDGPTAQTIEFFPSHAALER